MIEIDSLITFLSSLISQVTEDATVSPEDKD